MSVLVVYVMIGTLHVATCKRTPNVFLTDNTQKQQNPQGHSGHDSGYL